MASDEELAAQIAKDLAYCISSQSRYQVAREIIRTVRKDEREECAKVADEEARDDRYTEEGVDAAKTIAGRIRARTP